MWTQQGAISFICEDKVEKKRKKNMKLMFSLCSLIHTANICKKIYIWASMRMLIVYWMGWADRWKGAIKNEEDMSRK